VDVAESPLAEEAAVGNGAGGEIDRNARRARAGAEGTTWRRRAAPTDRRLPAEAVVVAALSAAAASASASARASA
jgi:hypothetical protein